MGASGTVRRDKGELMLNLTESIRPWHIPGYQWLKIQSANDAGFWSEAKAPQNSISQANRKVRVAGR
jgi:hypothetical protein